MRVNSQCLTEKLVGCPRLLGALSSYLRIPDKNVLFCPLRIRILSRRVARSLGIPWVADFAFPWSAYWLSGRPRFIEWFDQQLEASALRAAQLSPWRMRTSRAECPRDMEPRGKKDSIIPTGFSEDLFAEKSVPTASKFRAIYPGNHFCEKAGTAIVSEGYRCMDRIGPAIGR